MHVIEINSVSKSFKNADGSKLHTLDNIDLSVSDGEFVSLIGPSGCGKSTLLRLICGLDTPDEGSILRNGKTVQDTALDCGMVFQEPRLLPWLTVEENAAFGLRGMKAAEKSAAVLPYLEMLGIEGFAKSYPRQLSGGMAQRAAIARAMVTQPKILLLDEPFAALDALNRRKMQEELKKLRQRQSITMVLVTHDIDEALYLGDRVVIFSERPGHVIETVEVPPEIRIDRDDPRIVSMREHIYKKYFSDAGMEVRQ